VAAGIDHAIWTLCYAKGRLPRDFVEGSPVASNLGPVDIPMIYSVIQSQVDGRRKVFLVDTGFATGESMTGRKFADFESPAVTLAKVGLTPADVDTILLTHLHFDHVGNIGAFPNATIYVQRSEYEGWRNVLRKLGDMPSTKQSWVMSSMNPVDMPIFERAVAEGRVSFVDGSAQVAPGISLHLASDTHTFGSQWLEITTPDGPLVLAGDCVVSYANLERMWPPGYHQGNAWNLIECYDRLKALVGPDRLERIVVGHDMEVFRRHASFVEGSNPVAEILLPKGQPSRATNQPAVLS
jgi:N-acyl homoserine lactone hydrolase